MCLSYVDDVDVVIPVADISGYWSGGVHTAINNAMHWKNSLAHFITSTRHLLHCLRHDNLIIPTCQSRITKKLDLYLFLIGIGLNVDVLSVTGF